MNASCPYCNHAFTLTQPAARVTCPRCGETIPMRGATAPATARKADATIDLGSMVRQRLKLAFLASFVIFLLIAAVAFWKIRQEQKRNELPPPFLPPVSAATTPPLELRGLAFLPSNSNILFAVQPGPLLVYAEKSKQDSVELLTRNRVPASFLGTLAKAGVTLQQIDHLVGGFYIPDKDEELRIAFALVLRQRLPDEAKFLEFLQAKPDPKLGPDRFDVQFDKCSLRMRRASDTVWAFGLSAKDFAEGTELAPGMRSILTERVPRDAAAWLATDRAEWTKKPVIAALLNAASWPPDRIAILAKGRAAAASYSFSDSPRLSLSVQCSDEVSATQLRTYFKGLATGERSSAGGEGDWAVLEKPVDPPELFGTLKAMIDDAGR